MRWSTPLVATTLAAAACHHGPVGPGAPTTGAIAGLVRDATTGGGVGDARIVLRRPGSIAPVQAVTDRGGAYTIGALPPGHYEVTGYSHEDRIAVREVDVVAGRTAGLDFAIGAAEAPIELNAPSMAPLWRYRPPGADPDTGAIEGTVADPEVAERLANAVVTIVRDGDVTAEQVITDDAGRYRVDALAPGSYTVMTTYEMLRVGSVDIRHNHVQVTGGAVVVVPLWLETRGRRINP